MKIIYFLLGIMLLISCEKKQKYEQPKAPPLNPNAPTEQQLKNLDKIERDREIAQQKGIAETEDENPVPVSNYNNSRFSNNQIPAKSSNSAGLIKSVDIGALKSLMKPCGEGIFNVVIKQDGSVDVTMKRQDNKILSCVKSKLIRIRFAKGIIRTGTVYLP